MAEVDEYASRAPDGNEYPVANHVTVASSGNAAFFCYYCSVHESKSMQLSRASYRGRPCYCTGKRGTLVTSAGFLVRAVFFSSFGSSSVVFDSQRPWAQRRCKHLAEKFVPDETIVGQPRSQKSQGFKGRTPGNG